MEAQVHCITLFQHLSGNLCVFMCMDHFNAGARKGCSKLGIFKQICYNERSLNWRFAWGNRIYICIKFFIQKHSNSCTALSPPDWDVKNFVIIILNSTALENKSFWKIVHIPKQPKPTQADLYASILVSQWADKTEITHINSLTTWFQKQGLYSRQKSEYIWSPNEYLTLTLHLIWTQLLGSIPHYLWNQNVFFYMSQLRISCKSEKKIILKRKICFLYIRNSQSKEKTQHCLHNIQEYIKTVTNSSRKYQERYRSKGQKVQNLLRYKYEHICMPWILICTVNQN